MIVGVQRIAMTRRCCFHHGSIFHRSGKDRRGIRAMPKRNKSAEGADDGQDRAGRPGVVASFLECRIVEMVIGGASGTEKDVRWWVDVILPDDGVESIFHLMYLVLQGRRHTGQKGVRCLVEVSTWETGKIRERDVVITTAACLHMLCERWRGGDVDGLGSGSNWIRTREETADGRRCGDVDNRCCCC